MSVKSKIVIESQLFKIRKMFGYNRSDIAKRIKKSVRTVEKIERGEQEAKISEAYELAIVYRLSLDDIKLASENRLSNDKFEAIKREINDNKLTTI